MSPVCSMESKATLPVLVRRAGMRVAKTKFRRSWEGKDSWHVREKSVWFAYLLKEPPESPPSPVIRPKQHGKIAASTSTSKDCRSIRAYNTAKKSHHSLNQKLLSAHAIHNHNQRALQCFFGIPETETNRSKFCMQRVENENFHENLYVREIYRF